MSAEIYTPQAFKQLLDQNYLCAVLDVREQEEFSRSHILLASCSPLSRLELMVQQLVPCKKTPVILVDSGTEGTTSRAQRGQSVLRDMGYAAPIVLEGGMKAWLEAGFEEFTGVGALSKGFGEYVEEKLHTQRLDPLEIKKILDSGAPCVVIDVRPHNEYNSMNIPQALNAPGCEVTYRLADLVPDDDTTIIINCAGRTRSIIGTQTLRNAGIPNRVVALKGGTMNWQLSGQLLEYGSQRRTAPPSWRALQVAKARAAKVAEKYQVQFINAETLRTWQQEAEETCLYIFDVRQQEEYEMGHIPHSRHAAGGQLVQATDEYMAVRRARTVLVDDTEVRAIMTAHWLLQMGLPQVYVLQGGIGGSGVGAWGLEHGPEALPPLTLPAADTCSPEALRTALAAPIPPLLLNVGSSKIHRAGHIAHALWLTRAELSLAHAAHPDSPHIVITADTDIHAQLAAADARKLWPEAKVQSLQGGTPAWILGKLPLESGMPSALSAEDDVWYKPYTDIHAKPEAMQAYFDWEFGLVERIKRDGSVTFALQGTSK